jgi:peptidoglycan hydrolase-like protein with peptidoglycan-binding domain
MQIKKKFAFYLCKIPEFCVFIYVNKFDKHKVILSLCLKLNNGGMVMEKKEFIDSIKEGALKGRADYGIIPSLTIAQAVLESGWGTSQLSKKANNLFGIKAFADWNGQKITLPTTEWYDGQMKIINAEFRAYDNFNDSIVDHSKLLFFPRYRPVRECTDYKGACQKIYECGYATDPKYPEKLISIIESNRLFEFDEGFENSVSAVNKLEYKIMKFQQLCNVLNIRDTEGRTLEEDNILGIRTMSCIYKMPVLMIGCRGAAVEFIQEFVNEEPVDGDFGPKTLQSVIEYQKVKNIAVDGIVGTETWTALITT